MIAIVMGVSGSGKSTVGALLAERLNIPFLEGDSLHPAENLGKMARGLPLNEEDRRPWLAAVAAALAEAAAREQDLIASCSALRRVHRDCLRRAVPHLRFVHLAADRRVIQERLAAREGHFMPAGLLGSQFAVLEPPCDEPAVLTLNAALSPQDLAEAAAAWIHGDHTPGDWPSGSDDMRT